MCNEQTHMNCVVTNMACNECCYLFTDGGGGCLLLLLFLAIPHNSVTLGEYSSSH